MGFDEVWEKQLDGTMLLISSTTVPDYGIIDDDYLQAVIGSYNLIALTLSQILSTYNIIPLSAKAVDYITAFRIRQVISTVIYATSEDTIIAQIQDQLKVIRQSLWSHEIRMQNLEFKSSVITVAPSSADLITAQTIATQMLALNITIETIRTEGTNYKTTNNLV